MAIKLDAFYGVDKYDEEYCRQGINDGLIDGWNKYFRDMETLSVKVNYVMVVLIAQLIRHA